MNIHHDILTRDLKKHTQALALPLGRKVGSPGHEVTREYLLDRMKKMHLIPFQELNGLLDEKLHGIPHKASV